MSGFAKRTERKKQDIKRATLEMLKDTDPKNIKISDIAKKANVSQVTIYNHFHSKEQLIREVIIEYLIEQVEQREQFLKADRPFQEKVEYIIFEKKRAIRQIRVDLFQNLMKEDEQIRNVVESLYQTRIIPLFIEMVKEAQQKREIAPNISIDTLLFYLKIWREMGDRLHPSLYDERFTEELARLFFYGVKGADCHEC
ncbi:TetR/AcrR family transcriptional regulator [Thermaerobacillus caldiproteolyticus]|uniref:AcrR family transcriptional regulator n=1 Tax=Thermaerobacillus caldiproteolyticus TaxID=247480 RepID=A0A7V9Z7Q1_9BACL|nr:TetR/AcrR family transcriptional regulator [Anoxybacillus caldiproteolyticus]MBA2875504.1 AcrR family transcriptional regulator [Anoxybacillus caldiproteolyticus]